MTPLEQTFVHDPPSTALVERLNATASLVCEHSRDPCYLQCGVERSGSWQVIDKARRLEWLELVLRRGPAALDLCSVCRTRFVGAGDDPGTGKPRCICTGAGPAARACGQFDLVFRAADGVECRQRSGPVQPPPGSVSPFVLTWTGTRCQRCGSWRTTHDDTRTRVILWGACPPDMAPLDLCACEASP